MVVLQWLTDEVNGARRANETFHFVERARVDTLEHNKREEKKT